MTSTTFPAHAKSLARAALLFLFLCACSSLQANPAESVEQVERRRFAAMVAQDIAALEPMLAKELTYGHSNGEFQDKAQFLDTIRNGRLRYEAIGNPELLGGDPKLAITISADPEAGRLTIADNGIGMSHDEMIEALGTIARSGTRSFMERVANTEGKDGAQLIGQFGVGFYSAFMVAEKVEVVSRRAGSAEAWTWSSDGKGEFTVAPALLDEAPARGTRVTLHLMEEAKSYAERWTLERIVKEQSGHVTIPISLITQPGADEVALSDGAALWTRPKSERLLMEKPSPCMTAKVPMMDTGTASNGIIDARHVCRNTITTSTTSAIASSSVWMTESILACTKRVGS